ncbi:helix-turn-helix domain-containing protein [Sinorhizobium meliloti]|uniref:helix-turn-helix domain-containing protein n=1 Tax=Rhizobium meliloti TaxID=382 RepID=UPI001F194898|nr:helix-turn-helix transcriptional regulator [Sinorhizobium meliloti]
MLALPVQSVEHPANAKFSCRPAKPQTTCGRSTEKLSAAPGHAPSVRHKSANLGEKAGVSFQQIQQYEKGINHLSAGMLVMICQSLEVSPMEILGAYFPHERPSGSRMDWLQEKLLTAEPKLSGVRRALRDE